MVTVSLYPRVTSKLIPIEMGAGSSDGLVHVSGAVAVFELSPVTTDVPVCGGHQLSSVASVLKRFLVGRQLVSRSRFVSLTKHRGYCVR
jgi:hypothetical protein